MDNRTIDMVSVGSEDLATAIALMWENAPGKKATHYKIGKFKDNVFYFVENGKCTGHMREMVPDVEGKDTLILLWHEERDATPLPFPLDRDGAVQFAVNWLKEVEYPDLGNFDGTAKHGWRLFTEAWGYVANYHYAIIGVQPTWALYGK